MGDGTDESKAKMQKAIYQFWDYTGEMFSPSEEEIQLESHSIPQVAQLKESWQQTIASTLTEAGLAFPLSSEKNWFQNGGKKGIHTEHLGFILADLQFMQRAYPNSEW